MYSQWVEMTGVLRSAKYESGQVLISATRNGRAYTLHVLQYPKNWADNLGDGEIAARGVVTTRFNKRRQVLGINVDVQDAGFVKITRSGAADPYSVPTTAIDDIGQFARSEE